MKRLAILLVLAPALAHAHGSGGGGHGGGGGGHGGGGGGHGGGGGGHGGGGHGGGGHGGGGHHGSSGGSGWHPSSGIHVTGGGSYSGGSSGDDAGPPCDPNIDVEALGGCHQFGDWALRPDTPLIFIEMGTVVRHMPSTLSLRTGAFRRGSERFHYRMRLSSARTGDTSVDFVLRIGGDIRPGIYLGAEGEVGGVAAFAPVDVTSNSGTDGTPLFGQRHGFVDGAVAFGGVRERLGRATLSLELGVGARGIVHAFRMRYDGLTAEQDLSDAVLVVEPRVRLEGWLSPYVTGGVNVGANTMALGDWSAGAYFGIHTRAFDGR